MMRTDDLEGRARDAIDRAHAADPGTVQWRPDELAYTDRIEHWIGRLVPSPALALRLAARAQHLERWAIARDTFPRDRGGYLRWRAAVHQRQGQRVREILSAAGCDGDLVGRVAQLVSKSAPRNDPDAQALEDAACLVFMETELPEFHKQYTREKIIEILRKTWRKMSPHGRDLALTITLPGEVKDLIAAALAS